MSTAEAEATWLLGQVKWFDCRKGFGFVCGDSGLDVFVHFSVIEGVGFRRLRDGETGEYLPSRGPNGLFAVRVRQISDLRKLKKGVEHGISQKCSADVLGQA